MFCRSMVKKIDGESDDTIGVYELKDGDGSCSENPDFKYSYVPTQDENESGSPEIKITLETFDRAKPEDSDIENGSGVKLRQYCAKIYEGPESLLSFSYLQNPEIWNGYTDEITLERGTNGREYIVYLKLTDNVDNVSYWRTDVIAVEKQPKTNTNPKTGDRFVEMQVWMMTAIISGFMMLRLKGRTRKSLSRKLRS